MLQGPRSSPARRDPGLIQINTLQVHRSRIVLQPLPEHVMRTFEFPVSWDVGLPRPRWIEVLADGTQVLIQPVRTEDAATECAFIDALSPHARRNQFLGQAKHPSGEMIEQFTDLDYDHSIAFAAVVSDEAKDRIVGVGRYTATRDGTTCECAVTVLDDWQSKGLGAVLMRHLIHVADYRGITRMWSMDSAAYVAMSGSGTYPQFKAHQ